MVQEDGAASVGVMHDRLSCRCRQNAFAIRVH